mmetsp:Transcript_79114/g.140035  ORF Transcript_79114/g.140035 Transcript_79114/m.140035 type:complete len:123 (-) Transcript_79114:63-431(-)
MPVSRNGSSMNLHPGHQEYDAQDKAVVFQHFDEDGNDALSFYETVMLAHQMTNYETQAFPFSFQQQVRQSVVSVDVDNDGQVNIQEFSRWLQNVQTGVVTFTIGSSSTEQMVASQMVTSLSQ